MNEFSDSHPNSDDHEKQNLEEVRRAFNMVDPGRHIHDTLDYYRMRVAQVEMGVFTDSGPFARDSDASYSDSELADRIANLDERLQNALVSMVALLEAERLVRERQDELAKSETDAQRIAHETLTRSEVTVADLFPSEKDK